MIDKIVWTVLSALVLIVSGGMIFGSLNRQNHHLTAKAFWLVIALVTAVILYGVVAIAYQIRQREERRGLLHVNNEEEISPFYSRLEIGIVKEVYI